MFIRLIFILYECALCLFFLLYLPIYILRKKITPFSFKQRLGFYLPRVKDCVWFQVVSVGEVILIGSLVNRLNQIFTYPLVISTTTLSGYKVAKQRYASKAEVVFFHLDLSLVLRRFLKRIRPRVFVAIETELWPNLFYQLKKRKIPVLVLNGRISDKAFKRYLWVKPFLKEVFSFCECVGVQNNFYKERFIGLGCLPERVEITGNLKFESINVKEDYLERIKRKYQPLLKPKKELLFLAASTHHPEERLLLEVYCSLYKDFPQLKLLFAPRHIERTEAIERIISEFGFQALRISKLEVLCPQEGVYLLDTIGELLYFYSLADICFVGGSLIPYGGHNILEPLYFLKPTLFGPYMENFKDIAQTVLAKGAGIMVKDALELEGVLRRLTQDPELQKNLRQNALEVFRQERNSLERNLAIIGRYL